MPVVTDPKFARNYNFPSYLMDQLAKHHEHLRVYGYGHAERTFRYYVFWVEIRPRTSIISRLLRLPPRKVRVEEVARILSDDQRGYIIDVNTQPLLIEIYNTDHLELIADLAATFEKASSSRYGIRIVPIVKKD